MKGLLVVRAVYVSLLLVGMSGNLLAQSGNGGLTGTVEDTSNALIPGVSITATNTETGVTTTAITNESGAYNIPSLIPGTYKLTAELAGFRGASFTNIALGTNETKRFNFRLEVGGVATSIEVTIDAAALLTTSSATIDNVLPEYRVRDLPLVGNDVLDMIGVLGGARVSAAGGDLTTFAGISAGYVNTSVNGLSVQDGRYAAGVYSTTRINPDMVSEIRLVLTPVDAEMGRGNGQVQIQTRSGTNQYRGSAVWNVRNTTFDANSWIDNRTLPRPPRDWQNQNQYTLNFGGPIVKNKTFFFALWDGQITRIKENVNALVLTDCARNGIFRYFPDWNNGNASTVPTSLATAASSTAAITPVVDSSGNPITPATFRNGNPYTGTLQYVSVFGRLQNVPTKPDCSDAVLQPNSAWDAFRSASDSSGILKQYFDKMPRPNVFEGGDGLNTATFRWTRGRSGNDNVSGGTEDTTNRKQINLRLDHNFNSRHKVAVNWSYERDDSDNAGPNWPDGFWGSIQRRPQVWTTNFVSTLSPSLINEARWGLRRNVGNLYEALDNPKYKDAARSFFPNVNGLPIIVGLGTAGPTGTPTTASVNFQSSITSFNDFSRGNTTSLWTYSDTLSWTRAAHAIKFGGEFRQDKSKGFSNLNLIPHATGGPGSGTVPAPNFTNLLGTNSGLLATNNSTMQNLLLFLSGSIDTLNQLYFIKDAKSLDQFVDMRTATQRGTDVHQNEWSAFIKDDWKIHRNLTLNLGLRYEYYGPPWDTRGLTPSPIGGGYAAFGISGRTFENWFNPGARDNRTEFQFVGPNSPNPDIPLYKPDRNNFGPAVGFAWQVPWFGRDRTTLRGGYQLTYQGGGRSFNLDLDLGYAPGIIFTPALRPADGVFVTWADILKPNGCNGAGCVPVPNSQKPMQPIPVESRQTISGWSGNVYDPNFVAPYIQNFTLGLTRSVAQTMTVDVRYIGTRGVKLFGDISLNQRNFLTNGLKEAFDAARRGEESELLNRMFNGINIAGTGCNGVAGSLTCGPVGGPPIAGVAQTGATHLRASAAFQQNLANANYQGLANTLYTLNYNRALSGNGSLPVIPLNEQGAVLRRNGFDENFISPNPQFSTIGLRSNANSSNYHAMQAQFTMRPNSGISYQGTFTWGRSMGSPPNGGFAYAPERVEYGLLFGQRQYEFKQNGILELPIGPGKRFLGNSNGFRARLTESWRLSAIFNMQSGRPNTISGQQMLLNTGIFGATGTVDITPQGVAAFGPFPTKFGKVHWEKGERAGSYFEPGEFVRVSDPLCDEVTGLQNLSGLTSGAGTARCTLQALARPLPAGKTGVPGQITLPNGQPGVIVLQNAKPGTRGNLGLNTMEGAGLWQFDAAISKTLKIAESKSLEFRVDATNILNHPTPDDPGFASCLTGNLGTNLSLNSANDFGLLGGKCVGETPARRFQARLRLNF
jgi:hypothetical protein